MAASRMGNSLCPGCSFSDSVPCQDLRKTMEDVPRVWDPATQVGYPDEAPGSGFDTAQPWPFRPLGSESADEGCLSLSVSLSDNK